MEYIDDTELLKQIEEAIASNITPVEKKVLLEQVKAKFEKAETEIDYISLAVNIIEILGFISKFAATGSG